MPIYTVRTLIKWEKRSDQSKSYLYEERITAWNALSHVDAIKEAEKEVNEYAGDDSEALNLFQAYWLDDDIELVTQGAEVFSLLRESDLEPADYINAFFDTGEERQGDC
jgi:ankyrin repeat protein